MKNALLLFAALCAGAVLASTFFATQHATAVSDKRICAKVDALTNVIVALLERSQKSLPTNVFYRQHPELLADALRQNARAIREFRGAACQAS